MSQIDETIENFLGFEEILKLFESLTPRQRQFMVKMAHKLRHYQTKGIGVIEFKPVIIINKINKVDKADQVNAILGKNAQIKKKK